MKHIQIYTVHVRADGNEYEFWRDDTTKDIFGRSFKYPATLYKHDDGMFMGGRPVLNRPVMSLVDVLVVRDGRFSSVVRVQDPLEYLNWLRAHYDRLNDYVVRWEGNEVRL